MVWCGLTINGATEPYFIAKGETIRAQNYTQSILPFAKEEGIRLFGSENFIFQQDGATAHTSNKAQNWCKRHFKFFIEKTR